MFMSKKAVSVTLDRDNLVWLKGQTVAAGGRSVSETLDRLITEARFAGRVRPDSIRSVVGTIDLGDDPNLERADEYVRSVVARSVRQSLKELRGMPPRARRARRG